MMTISKYVSYFGLHYLVLCIASICAFPLAFVVVLFTAGFGIVAVPPLLFWDTLRYDTLAGAVIIATAVYILAAGLLYRKRKNAWSAIPHALISCGLAFVSFAALAEMNWGRVMAREAKALGLHCVEKNKYFAVRIRDARLAMHSDERMFYTPHATAQKDGHLFLWSFRESTFVEDPEVSGLKCR